MRLNKAIAHAGYCSRRAADDLIKTGQVAINGIVVDNCATHVDEKDTITINGQALKQRQETKMWCYYKPVGLVTTHQDPQGRPTVFEALRQRLKCDHVISVGRLDINSEGLLLLTNNGDIAKDMMHPSSKLQRIYRVRVYGSASMQQLKTLTQPFQIDGVRYQPFEFLHPIQPLARGNHWLTVRIFEGKYREIRKAMNSIGLQVNRLVRTHYGPYELGNKKPGDIWEVSLNCI